MNVSWSCDDNPFSHNFCSDYFDQRVNAYIKMAPTKFIKWLRIHTTAV